MTFALGVLTALFMCAVENPPAAAADRDSSKAPSAKTAKSKTGASKSKQPAVDFEKQIRPLFATHCVKCHGEKKQEGGLRLDHRASALRGGDTGKVIIPGKSGVSELIKRVSSKDEFERMPPPGSDPNGKTDQLSAKQIHLLRRWIDQGANWPKDDEALTVKTDHWAYQPIKDSDPPAFDDSAAKQWIRNSIDAFVLAKLREKGLEPSPPADRYTLIKRLYYDVIGLPPKPEDVDAFVNDSSPNAYEKVVDRLLASEHFGERWGRHWLDKARYADSDGYEKDRPRPNAWRYRDWVIEAINRDMPFDEFTRQQLAGDLLPDAGLMEQLATAFHRQTLTNTEGGTDKEEFRVEAIFDRVATTGTVWLGLTVGCAQCHSHKYDPITQAEYYRLFAFFNNGDETTTQVPRSETAVKEYRRKKAAFDKKLQQLTNELKALKQSKATSLAAWEKQIQQKLAQEAGNVIRYHDPSFERGSTKSGAKLKQQKDQSFLASGTNPETDTYTLIARVPTQDGKEGGTSAGKRGITGFRIDALTHKSLGGKGPGRTPHGNFVLSRFRVFVVSPEGKEREVALGSAKADYSQKGFPPKGALNDKPRTGWAISRQMGKPHWIEFQTEELLNVSGDERLRIVLEQSYGRKHTLGRFRVRAITGTQPRLPIPDDVREILAVAPGKRSKAQRDRLLDYYTGTLPEVKQQQKEIAAFKKQAPKSPMMKVRIISQRTNNPRTTHILRRGDFLQPQDEVQPGTPAVLHDIEPRNTEGMPDRLDLANWLVDPDNPLTPRVTVNHMWQHLFGEGLVTTMNDFGVRGEQPSHPQLLDWLAKEFLRRKWSRKAMIKLIVMSATYRQSSSHNAPRSQTQTPRSQAKARRSHPAGSPAARPRNFEKIDPENRLLWRQNRFRVEAEIVRDIYLAASGLLSKKVGGPSVFPPMSPDVAALSYANNFKWKTSKGADRYRRGMYTFFKRTAPHPTLMTFDCPDSNTTKVKRRTSNTPLMALTTLNNMVFVEASQALAKRVLTDEKRDTDAERITRAFRLCVARPPAENELSALQNLLEESRRWYADHPEEAAKLIDKHRAEGVAATEAAAWVATCRIIMNMDEFLTRE